MNLYELNSKTSGAWWPASAVQSIPELYQHANDLKSRVLQLGGVRELCYWITADNANHVIENWFITHLEDFRKMTGAYYKEYDPLENYDRLEDWTDNHGARKSTTNDDAATDSTQHGAKSSTSSDENKTFVYEDESYHPENQTSGTTSDAAYTDTMTTGARKSTTNEDAATDTHTGHLHGNIGVTRTDEMMRAFYDLVKDNYNLYDVIANMLISEFTVSWGGDWVV